MTAMLCYQTRLSRIDKTKRKLTILLSSGSSDFELVWNIDSDEMLEKILNEFQKHDKLIVTKG